MHLRQNFIMQDTPLLGSKQFYIDNATAQQSGNGLHRIMVAQGIKDTLPTCMRKVHIFVRKDCSILTGAEIERCYRSQVVIDRHDPADHWLALERHTHTCRGSV